MELKRVKDVSSIHMEPCITMHFAARAKRIEQDPLVYELWLGRQSLSQPKQLNREQAESVDISMRKQFQLIQGPPGNDIHKQ